MGIKCDTCCINQAQVKDYRNVEGIYNKYLVCPNCFMLNDKWFFKLNYAKKELDKRKIISQITEGTWKDYIFTK